MKLLIRLLVNTAALAAAAFIVPGISYTGTLPGLLGVGLVFGAVNVFIRPILTLLSLPVIFLTLGLFAFVLNAFMLWLTGRLAEGFGLGFRVEGFWAAILGALVVSVVGALLNLLLVDDEKKE
jgi:putative membrane protein